MNKRNPLSQSSRPQHLYARTRPQASLCPRGSQCDAASHLSHTLGDSSLANLPAGMEGSLFWGHVGVSQGKTALLLLITPVGRRTLFPLLPQRPVETQTDFKKVEVGVRHLEGCVCGKRKSSFFLRTDRRLSTDFIMSILKITVYLQVFTVWNPISLI